MKFALVESISIRKWKGSAKQLVLQDWLGENEQKHNGARLELALSHQPSESVMHCQIRKWQSKKVYWAENRCHYKHLVNIFSYIYTALLHA